MFAEKIKNIFSSIAIYYKKDSGTYWDTITECNVNTSLSIIGKYYLNFEIKAHYPGNFDKNGIPLYKGIYQPVVICQYAFGIYELLTRNEFKDEALINKFLVQADWLMQNCSELNESAVWFYNNDIIGYDIKAPWCSAMAQGEAISVLLRAYNLTRQDKYLKIAEKALSIFEYEVKDKGIKNIFNNYIIYEEYPSARPNVVLNGLIFSLFGLYDFYLCGNLKAKNLYNEGLNSVEKLLPYFDTGYWSQYNLYSYPKIYLASYRYHMIHIEQLKALAMISGKNIFKQYSDKWEGYSNSFYIKTYALVRKILNNNRISE